MPDVITLLEQDHRTVERLFAEFAERGDPRIAERICDELTVHSTLEEVDVYPRLREVDADAAREAQQEHNQARELIARIRTSSDAELADLVRRLQAAISHHVHDEEQGIFPILRARLGSELELMGRRVEAHKHELTMTVGDTGGTAGDTGGRVAGRADVTDLSTLKKAELYEMAKQAGIDGRSQMTKAQLARALERRD